MPSRHEITAEPPDIIKLRPRGDLTKADAEEVLTTVQQLSAGREDCFELVDLSQAGNLSPDARRLIAAKAQELRFRAVAMYGASFHMRLVANLLINARRLLSKQNTPTAFFKTEAEARAWIEEQRQKIAAEKR